MKIKIKDKELRDELAEIGVIEQGSWGISGDYHCSKENMLEFKRRVCALEDLVKDLSKAVGLEVVANGVRKADEHQRSPGE